MSARSTPLNQCLSFIRALKQYRWLWIVPTIALTLAAGLFASVRSTKWKAAQAFIVRDEAVGSMTHQGRFSSTDALKSFQETILELARNRTAVATALKELGPPTEANAKQWPTVDAIESLQGSIQVTAPRGGEFGKTEVIYLSVTGKTKELALQRTEAIYKQIEARLADLRTAKAASLVDETSDRLKLAYRGLNEATQRLEAMESEVGSDLGELRILNDSGSGDSNLRASLNQLKIELRQARAAAEANEQQEKMLIAASKDPENLLATSSRLFNAQPNLRRLNEGLVAAQLRVADLAGSMTPDHPLVMSARDTAAQVQRDLYNELSAALRGVQSDLEVNQQLVASLQQQHDATQQRLLRLASMRARYNNLVAEVRQHSDLVENAQQELAAAHASRAAAESASLITRFDTPVVGSSPVGPSRSTIVAAGLFGGLMTGFGLVFLAMPGANGQGRRISDYLGYGRRASDRQGGRRSDDRAAEGSPSVRNRRAADSSAQARRSSDPATPQSPAATNWVDRRSGGAEQRQAAPEASSVDNRSQPAETPEPTEAIAPATTTPCESSASSQTAASRDKQPTKRSLLAGCLSELGQSR